MQYLIFVRLIFRDFPKSVSQSVSCAAGNIQTKLCEQQPAVSVLQSVVLNMRAVQLDMWKFYYRVWFSYTFRDAMRMRLA